MGLSVPGSLGWHYEHRDTVTIMDAGGTFYLNQLWNMCPICISLEYAQYIIPPVDRPEPCQGGLVWGCETSGPGLSWQRENDAWSGLSGPGGSLGKNFPGKVSHPLSRPRSHNTNMLCDESHGIGGVCMLRRTQQWQLTKVCVCFQDSDPKTNIWREAEGISLKMVT